MSGNGNPVEGATGPIDQRFMNFIRIHNINDFLPTIINYRQIISEYPVVIQFIDKLIELLFQQGEVISNVQNASVLRPMNISSIMVKEEICSEDGVCTEENQLNVETAPLVDQVKHVKQEILSENDISIEESTNMQWSSSADAETVSLADQEKGVKEEVWTGISSSGGAETVSLADQVKEAAESALLNSNFIFEPVSGMYYDCTTGYYYDPNLCLYYDGSSGCYYQYDQDKKEFKYHSHLSAHTPKNNEPVTGNNPTWNRAQDHANGDLGKTTANHEPPVGDTKYVSNIYRSKPHCRSSEYEEGECTDDSDASNSTMAAVIENICTVGHPAMRLIVVESDNPQVKLGTLFLITCNGGSIGREGAHDIILPDTNISKNHLKFTYVKESMIYYATDIGSKNGTYLNGEGLFDAQTPGTPKEVVHGSILQLSGIKLLCHIHVGNDTCMECEPGVVQSELNSAYSKEKSPMILKTDLRLQHKQELARMKKQYGLQSEYSSPSKNESSKSAYVDRAHKRRGNTHIDNTFSKIVASSVEESIGSENIGYKLLSKMGWSSGEALGKTGHGRKEPVPMVSNPGTSGLGLSTPNLLPVDPVFENKRIIWQKAQKRFNQSCSTTVRPWSEDQERSDN